MPLITFELLSYRYITSEEINDLICSSLAKSNLEGQKLGWSYDLSSNPDSFKSKKGDVQNKLKCYASVLYVQFKFDSIWISLSFFFSLHFSPQYSIFSFTVSCFYWIYLLLIKSCLSLCRFFTLKKLYPVHYLLKTNKDWNMYLYIYKSILTF